MEIKVDTNEIRIPEGYNAIIYEDKIVFIPNKFKDGDVLTLLSNNKTVFIFKENKLNPNNDRNSYYVCFTANNHLDITLKDSPFFCGYRRNVRLATNEEKQFLFDKMKEQGLRWNPKTKEIEKIRKRVLYGDMYLCINGSGEIIEVRDYEGTIDNIRYNLGNYYLLKERKQAEKDAAEIRAIFERRVKVQVQV